MFFHFASIMMINSVTYLITSKLLRAKRGSASSSPSRNYLINLFIIMLVNFLIGNPKMQSVHGNFIILGVFQVLLFTDTLSLIVIVCLNALLMFNMIHKSSSQW